MPKPPAEEVTRRKRLRAMLQALARLLLSTLAAALYAVGYVTRKVVIEAPRWIAAAVRLGWRDAR